MIIPSALSAEKWLLETLIGVGIIYFLYVLIFFPISKANIAAQRYIINDGKIEYVEGFLTKEKRFVSFGRITDIALRQTIIERWYNVGTIYISTAGSSGYELVMLYVDKHEELYDTLKGLLDKHNISV